MPRIPIILENQPLEAKDRSLGAAAAPGEALAGLGAAAANIGDSIAGKELDIMRARETIDKTSQSAQQASALYDQVLADPDIPNEKLTSNLADGLKIIHDRIGKDIKDPQVQLNFDRNFQGFMDSHLIEARAVQRKRESDAFQATSAEAIDNLSKLSVDASGPQLDQYLGLMHGIVGANVRAHYITEQQGREQISKATEEIYVSKYLKQIRDNPVQAFKELQSDTELDPVKKQTLLDHAETQVVAQQKEVLAEQRRQEALAEKAFKDQQQRAVTDMTSKALDGKLTHQELADQNSKWLLSREDYEHVYDLINKPTQEPASDPHTLSTMTNAVLSVSPQVTQSQLWDMRLQGKLNLRDYTTLNEHLAANIKWNIEQGTSNLRDSRGQAEKVLGEKFGGDPNLESQAIGELSDRTRAGQNPSVILPEIIKKYEPSMIERGAAAQFNSARNAYQSAVDAQRQWSSGIGGTIRSHTPMVNPNDEKVIERRNDLLNKAKAANKILAPAAKGVKDGTQWLRPDGIHVMVVGGQVIAQ